VYVAFFLYLRVQCIFFVLTGTVHVALQYHIISSYLLEGILNHYCTVHYVYVYVHVYVYFRNK
jgi:hypothetical protein